MNTSRRLIWLDAVTIHFPLKIRLLQCECDRSEESVGSSTETLVASGHLYKSTLSATHREVDLKIAKCLVLLEHMVVADFAHKIVEQ